MKFAVVAIAFNRAESLLRLLHSLNAAEYDGDSVDLVVSIDFSSLQADVLAVVHAFFWPYGDKIVIAKEVNLGLRKHVLSCGDLTSEYDAIAVFEDDIVASRAFYRYLKSTLSFYGDDRKIAGISLYSPSINEMSGLPFKPMPSRFDVYFMKSAQSWGQCWTRGMWNDFKSWYERCEEPLVDVGDMPRKIYAWPESSWKKYYMKYIVECDKYFIYPYFSFSTNTSEVGVHNKKSNPRFQVPLQHYHKKLMLPRFSEGVVYDSFFEREGLTYSFEGVAGSVCCDLYGTKKVVYGDDFLLTKRKLPFKLVDSYSLSLRPHEMGFVSKEKGGDIYLYRVSRGDKINLGAGRSFFKDAMYYSNMPWYLSLLDGLVGCVFYLKIKLIGFMRK